ncbi:hypothetical protein PGIGA_G00254860, partial [Pangasianodon gigas]|nr:hypothetical protein [Pangasianodon gigas]
MNSSQMNLFNTKRFLTARLLQLSACFFFFVLGHPSVIKPPAVQDLPRTKQHFQILLMNQSQTTDRESRKLGYCIIFCITLDQKQQVSAINGYQSFTHDAKIVFQHKTMDILPKLQDVDSSICSTLMILLRVDWRSYGWSLYIPH